MENSIKSYNMIYDSFQNLQKFEILDKSEMYNVKIAQLPKNDIKIYNYELKNSYEINSLLCYYQIDEQIFGENKTKCFDTLNWLHTFLQFKFYNYIRTNENLGNIFKVKIKAIM